MQYKGRIIIDIYCPLPPIFCSPFIWVPHYYMNSFLQCVFILVLGHEVKYCYAALTL